MPDFEHLLYEKRNNGVLLTMNRPEALNALSRDLEDEVQTAFDEAEADPEIRAIVLTGAGRAFSAGYDIAGGGANAPPPAPTVWPYGIQEGTSVAALLDNWRTRDKPDRFLHMWIGLEHLSRSPEVRRHPRFRRSPRQGTPGTA